MCDVLLALSISSQRLSYLPLGGKVNLSNPDHEFHLLEDYGDNPNEAPPEPNRVFLGRLISHGQRHLIQKYAVRNRYFIGNTSMDAQLSLIMANMAQVYTYVCVQVMTIAVQQHSPHPLNYWGRFWSFSAN